MILLENGVKMNKDLVSFIFVNRGGKNLQDAIRNIKEVYADVNKEIIVIEQDDNLPFMRGQLFNIGVKYANGKYIALSDNDMFHLRKVDWIDIYETVKKPLIGFKWISQIKLNNGKAIITETKECPTGFGGFNFMTKNDFISFNGFSNLFIGWGYEDNFYSNRFSYIRIPQNLGHITHPTNQKTHLKNILFNKEIKEKHIKEINPKMDGYLQTTYTLVSDKIVNTVRYIKVKNISVIDEFQYKSFIKKHQELLK